MSHITYLATLKNALNKISYGEPLSLSKTAELKYLIDNTISDFILSVSRSPWNGQQAAIEKLIEMKVEFHRILASPQLSEGVSQCIFALKHLGCHPNAR